MIFMQVGDKHIFQIIDCKYFGQIHERVAVFLGSREEVEIVTGYHHN